MKIEKIEHGTALPYSDQFKRWWSANYIPAVATTQEAAWAAWQAGAVAVPLEKPDWDRINEEIREAAVLAKRHGLIIQSVPGTDDRRVRATRSGFYAATDGWSAMIKLLNGMAQEGDL